MSIVTITSDLGTDSFSLAALKGTLYNSNTNDLHLVDITNSIRSYDIVEAAFVFSNAYSFFPANTIHILAVNPFYGQHYQLLLLEADQQYFIAPNNGLIPLIFDQQIQGKIIKLGHFKDTKAYYEILGKTVEKLVNGVPVEELGELDPELFQRINLKPVLSKNIIRGTIIHVDKFGNLVSNITRTAFEKLRGDRDFAVYFRHKDPIVKINTHYHEVPVGDELCLFNMSGHLEIAINLGNASDILGLYLDDTIQIDFL